MSVKIMRKTWKDAMSRGEVVLCGICDDPINKLFNITKGPLTADHIIPVSLGGKDANENLQPAHHSCNVNRGNMLLAEFKQELDIKKTIRQAIKVIESKNEGLIWERTKVTA